MPLAVALTLLTLAAVIFSGAVVPTTSAPAPSLPPYTNYTVGGPTGWSFDSQKNSSAVNYSSWATAQSFYLGDYLIFEATTNLSVVQTYNDTTYQICDADEDDGSDTLIYSGGGGGGIAIPLTAEGENYFFSGDGDGIECENGMKFQIVVEKGRGLPAALSQPPPPPYVDPGVPPPPDAVVGNAGGSPQEESFYTGGVEAGGGAQARWMGILLLGGALVLG